ncbi:MAG: CPBP family glutamic-type intramembrane protease, partial [Bdellovibrionota bacterium]
LIRREVRPLTWENLKKRLWLSAPTDPHSGRRRPILFLWVIPVLVYGFALGQTGVLEPLRAAVLRLAPGLGTPAYAEVTGIASPQFVGAWWVVGLALVSCLFNYLLGEELLFRGILLPRMNGVFGRFDWLANACLFAAYHVHKASYIPLILISAHLSKEVLMEGINTGVFAVIEKPLTEAALVNYCVTALKHRRLSKLLNRTLNLLLYQYSDLDDFLKASNKEDVRLTLKQEVNAVIEQRKQLRAVRKG